MEGSNTEPFLFRKKYNAQYELLYFYGGICMKVFLKFMGIPVGLGLIWYGVTRIVKLIKERREEKIHGTKPGTYEVNMEN